MQQLPLLKVLWSEAVDDKMQRCPNVPLDFARLCSAPSPTRYSVGAPHRGAACPEGLPSAVLFWCLAAQMDWLVPSLILWLPFWIVPTPFSSL